MDYFRQPQVCVRKGTVGGLAKMKFGDEILAINGTAVENLRTRQAARLIVANDSCVLTMRRDTRASQHTIRHGCGRLQMCFRMLERRCLNEKNMVWEKHMRLKEVFDKEEYCLKRRKRV